MLIYLGLRIVVESMDYSDSIILDGFYMAVMD